MEYLKAAETFVRKYRSFLSPTSWLFVARFRKNYPASSSSKPKVLIDLRDNRIDIVGGRHAALLLQYFQRTGFQVILAPNYDFLASFRNKAYKRALFKQGNLSVTRDPEMLAPYAIWVKDPTSPNREIDAQKTLTLVYDRAFENAPNQLVWPFRLHPAQFFNNKVEKLPELRKQPKAWRIFFAGNASPDKYNNPILNRRYRKLTRAACLETITQHLGTERIKYLGIANEAKIGDSDFVKVDFQRQPISSDEWLATLAKARFFIAASGVHMPMSHNAIESMAVGAIPVIEYPELFHPKLSHMENCIAYEGSEDLKSKIDLIFEMSEEQIESIREGTIEYYEKHLSHASIVNKIIEHTEQTLEFYPNYHLRQSDLEKRTAFD